MSGLLTACIFGSDRNLDHFSLKRLFLDRMGQSPQVLLLIETKCNSDALLEEVQSFVEEINREDSVYPLVALILSQGIQLLQRPDCFNTVPTMPIGRVLNPSIPDLSALWGRYLHSRAAWECGGDMHLAYIYGVAWNEIRPFDDDAVEESCSRLAARRWSEITHARHKEFEQYFADVHVTSPRGREKEWSLGLIEDGLLWQPPDQCQLMPTVWAVRATASARVGNGRLQRAALVNSILVSEALAWCFQLEAMERARYDDDSELTECADAHEHFRSFVSRKTYSVAPMYPKKYPLQLSLKDFEPFGWFCNRLGMEKRAVLRKRLLSLRNSLCHGHFVGWGTIYDLVTIHAQMT